MNKHFNYNDYRIRKLSFGETIKSFDCGDADLNDFIVNDADIYRAEDVVRNPLVKKIVKAYENEKNEFEQ